MEENEFGFGGTLYFVDKRTNCPCCKGAVNSCSGPACEELGICYCMVADEDDLKLNADEDDLKLNADENDPKLNADKDDLKLNADKDDLK